MTIVGTGAELVAGEARGSARTINAALVDLQVRAADLAAMAAHGVRCFLVGEALMRQPDVEKATRELLGG